MMDVKHNMYNKLHLNFLTEDNRQQIYKWIETNPNLDQDDNNKLGFAFLAVSTIKLLVSASLILILVKGFGKPKAIGINFAAVYFLYIIFLSIFTLRLLNKK